MEYPLLIDGKAAGNLTAQEEGLYIVFTARIRARTELTRLWLHGAGEEKYLGVMMREGEDLCLERRISRRELGALWKEASYASNRSGEEKRESAGENTADEAVPKPDDGKEEAREDADREPAKTKQGPDARQGGEENNKARNEQSEEDGLIWYRTESGTLTAFDGKRRLTALPARLRHGNERVELRTIEGREYMIF